MGVSARIERVGANDLTTLATDKGQVPMNIAALLVLEQADAPAANVAMTIAERLTRIRRFRQRLCRPPLGAGAPVWVDDESFHLAAHVSRGSAEPVSEQAALDLASDLVCTRLPSGRPLWRLVWTPMLEGRTGVIVVLHHVLADGMGGLAVLTAIADEVLAMPAPCRPMPGPSRRELTRDAMRRRARAARDVARGLRRAVAGLREMGMGVRRPSVAARTSLTRRTSGRRVVRVVSVELLQVQVAGRRYGGTVNDVVVAAVAGALFDFLEGRDEHPRELVISVPVSARLSAAAGELGNQVGAVPVAVPRSLDPVGRLRMVSARTTEAKGQQRGSSALVLSWLFRALAAVHLGQYFVDHQRLVHTFETNLRGPEQRLELAGARVQKIVPIAVNPGNVGVSFDTLSYAGELVVAIVADPGLVPDIDVLTRTLARELRTL